MTCRFRKQDTLALNLKIMWCKTTYARAGILAKKGNWHYSESLVLDVRFMKYEMLSARANGSLLQDFFLSSSHTHQIATISPRNPVHFTHFETPLSWPSARGYYGSTERPSSNPTSFRSRLSTRDKGSEVTGWMPRPSACERSRGGSCGRLQLSHPSGGWLRRHWAPSAARWTDLLSIGSSK